MKIPVTYTNWYAFSRHLELARTDRLLPMIEPFARHVQNKTHYTVCLCCGHESWKCYYKDTRLN